MKRTPVLILVLSLALVFLCASTAEAQHRCRHCAASQGVQAPPDAAAGPHQMKGPGRMMMGAPSCGCCMQGCQAGVQGCGSAMHACGCGGHGPKLKPHGCGGGCMGACGMGGCGCGVGMHIPGGGAFGGTMDKAVLDATKELRKSLMLKRFEYFEAMRDPDTPAEEILDLQKKMQLLSIEIQKESLK